MLISLQAISFCHWLCILTKWRYQNISLLKLKHFQTLLAVPLTPRANPHPLPSVHFFPLTLYATVLLLNIVLCCLNQLKGSIYKICCGVNWSNFPLTVNRESLGRDYRKTWSGLEQSDYRMIWAWRWNCCCSTQLICVYVCVPMQHIKQPPLFQLRVPNHLSASQVPAPPPPPRQNQRLAIMLRTSSLSPFIAPVPWEAVSQLQ